MIGVLALREGLHNRLLKLRSIEAMLARPSFVRLWDDSSEELKATLQDALDKGNREEVATWIKDHPSLELGERTLSDLKRIARNLGIRNYSRKGKPELIRDIQEAENGTQ